MTDKQRYDIDDLVTLMARLRDPVGGCPWDLEQDYRSIVPYTLEEVYEVIDTIERDDYDHLGEELGDLLFQVVFYARLGEEDNRFDFGDVVHGIVDKLVARHPHVFPGGTLSSRREGDGAVGTAAIKGAWEAIKHRERQAKGRSGELDDIPRVLPALSRSQKVQKRAARSGFDWKNNQDVIAKIREELAELEAEMETAEEENIAEEMGDLLFSCVNLARHLGVDAEAGLRRATDKFEIRYRRMEKMAAEEGVSFGNLDALAQDVLWQAAKESQ